jgi:guanylate kinase
MFYHTAERRGLCLVIAAPSGAGKSTLTQAILSHEPELVTSVSVTTRPRRAGERDGVHYLFRPDEVFEAMLKAGELLEHATVFGRRYGTPRAPVEAALAAGRDVVFDIDWQGWRQLKAALPADCVGLFILPPSLEALADRLGKRASDDAAEVERRMAAAVSEMEHWDEFDHVLVNDDLERCVALTLSVLHAARCRTTRASGVARMLADLRSGLP